MVHRITVATTIQDTETRIRISEACRTLACCFHGFATSTELLASIGHVKSDILVMHLNGAGRESLSVQRRFREALNPLTVLYIAKQADIPAVVDAMQLGAVDVLSEDASIETLQEALSYATTCYQLRAVWLSETRGAHRKVGGLTDRQREVMKLALRGFTNKAIAGALHISPKTVEKHRQLIHQRTKTSTLPELVRTGILAERQLSSAFCLTPDGSEAAMPGDQVAEFVSGECGNPQTRAEVPRASAAFDNSNRF